VEYSAKEIREVSEGLGVAMSDMALDGEVGSRLDSNLRFMRRAISILNSIANENPNESERISAKYASSFPEIIGKNLDEAKKMLPDVKEWIDINSNPVITAEYNLGRVTYKKDKYGLIWYINRG